MWRLVEGAECREHCPVSAAAKLASLAALACSRVLELAELLSNHVSPNLADRLPAVVAAGTADGFAGLCSDRAQAALAAMDAAAVAAAGMASCASSLAWPHTDAFRVCTAAGLVLTAGRLSLAAQLAAASHCCQRGGQPSHDSLGMMWNSVFIQLRALHFTIGRLASPLQHKPLAAAVAATVAPHHLLLPYLTTASEVLLMAYHGHDPGQMHDPASRRTAGFAAGIAAATGTAVDVRQTYQHHALHTLQMLRVFARWLSRSALCCTRLALERRMRGTSRS